MPATQINQSDLVFLNDLQQVRTLLQQGAIRADTTLQTMLPAPAAPPVAAPTGFGLNSLLWIFTDRAPELLTMTGDRSVFLSLFIFVGTGMTSVTTPGGVHPTVRLKIGKSGSGNRESFIDIPEVLEQTDWSLRLVTLDIVDKLIRVELSQLVAPNRLAELRSLREVIQLRHVFLPNGLSARRLTAIGSSRVEVPAARFFTPANAPSPVVLPIATPFTAATLASQPTLVHISKPDNQSLTQLATAVLPPPVNDTKTKPIFDFLSNLPANHIDDHGKKSMDVVQSVVPGATLRYVSSFYPFLTPVAKLTSGTFRFGMAFGSPVITALRSGDIIFISQSVDFMVSGTSRKLPVLFDLAVHSVATWLEKRGVLVLFSAGGGSAGEATDLTSGLVGQFLPADVPLPGLLIGGVTLAASGATFSSNFGAVVSCYAPPVAVPSDATSPQLDGSSGATAYVAGLMLAAQRRAKSRLKPLLTPPQLKKCLMESTTALTSSGQAVRQAPTLANFLLRVDQLLTTGL
ncbi:S8/S53 family peptidase [Fibrella aquatilis]|uniref:S8/S53 family peptidase n=1 Tax=Fibrella aquatilis TaxID=2817059 RepID=A0A939JUG0_9BACT|nr:S8/S53 family peptidase [Fibrella aquatilis]MBO0929737.1 S8/S53 family peptidase [Fibrella aquatilis]